jgi:hypothetical protein
MILVDAYVRHKHTYVPVLTFHTASTNTLCTILSRRIPCGLYCALGAYSTYIQYTSSFSPCFLELLTSKASIDRAASSALPKQIKLRKMFCTAAYLRGTILWDRTSSNALCCVSSTRMLRGCRVNVNLLQKENVAVGHSGSVMYCTQSQTSKLN